MTELLLKIFVKNYNDGDKREVHSAVGNLAGFTGIACNLILCAGKFIVGAVSGSVSISADAINNLTDSLSSVATLLGFRMAQQPADKDHPYGHARYEYLAGLVIAAFIFFAGFELVKSSVAKILAPVAIDVSAITMGVLIASVLVKLWMSRFYKKLGEKIGSSTLTAASADSRNDVLSTSAVIIGCIVERFFNLTVDGYIGLAVAIFIIISGFGIAKEGISLLLGKQVDNETEQQLEKTILSYEKVLGIHDMLIHDYGPGRCYASVHVEFNAEESLIVCHDIADEIEKRIAEEMNINLVIHFDPIVLDDEETNEMKLVVEDIMASIGGKLSIHDFRIVRGGTISKLMFDVFIPYDNNMKREDIRKAVEKGLVEKGRIYTTDIRFDGKM